ncbi:cora-domain-containing protein [Xylariaceae sp. FL0804]|nr:cora-domain-containing protein [Xylariaceae sp. FL0804]
MPRNPYSALVSSQRNPDEPSTSSNAPASASGSQHSKKKHRAGRKHKKPRRKSFAALAEEALASDIDVAPPSKQVYAHGRNLSSASIDSSEALLDHRDQRYPRPRRPSILPASYSMPQPQSQSEIAPLLANQSRMGMESDSTRAYGSHDSRKMHDSATRRSRRGSSRSSLKLNLGPATPGGHNVNYPPSMPGTPPLGPSDHRTDMSFGDSLMRDDLAPDGSRRNSMVETEPDPTSFPFDRRHTLDPQAEEDVCFPQEGMSEMADEEIQQARNIRSPRRRRKKWPDLRHLEEWATSETENKNEERRIKRITEPQLVNGRLRPVHKGWSRVEEDAPYRFTYFNEELQSTIHTQTISELVQPDGSFKELFVPDPPLLSDDSSSEDEEDPPQQAAGSVLNGGGSGSKSHTRQSSLAPRNTASDSQAATPISPRQMSTASEAPSREHSGDATPVRSKSPFPGMKSPTRQRGIEPRFGDRPVWWLDVLSPTKDEMKVLSKTFGIHPLTAEDILHEEQREKVELFRHYYFVNYRSFDQDSGSENFLEPVNMYVVVFREGVISFHFAQTPHPANVRRRIRHLKDSMVLTADWISYGIIDDITDAYLPYIQSIEDEVDDIDDAILQLHSASDPSSTSSREKRASENEKGNNNNPQANADLGRDMLRRVGDCRKRVMSLYRLLGNKADVIKGFAKRCNEHWQVAPRSEIGLYLGDIQDHIVTMTSNLTHYEAILARCHSSYIAQINIRMTERQEQTGDVLGKLTVLGTIVLPMNIITGLWGMNVWVPGQEYEGSLTWFFCITAGLVAFGLACFWIAKRVYKIV